MITQAKVVVHKPKLVAFNAQLTFTSNDGFHLTPLAVPLLFLKPKALQNDMTL